MKILLILAALVTLTGCAFKPNIAVIDPTPRAPTVGPVDFFRNEKPSQPYRPIALYSVDGEPREEAGAAQCFLDLARQAGADALLFEPPLTPSSTWKGIDPPDERFIFRATAVVYDPQK